MDNIEKIQIQQIKFALVVVEDGILPAFTGHLLRGLIYSIIGDNDPELIDMLHHKSNKRPYSISKIFLEGFDKNRVIRNTGEIRLVKGDQIFFYLNLIGLNLKNRALSAIIKFSNNNLRIQTIPVQLVTIQLNPLVWPSIESVNGLYAIEFETPTQLQTSESKIYLLPDPEKLFSTLARLWLEILPEVEILPIDKIRELARKNTYIRNLNLVSREVDMGKIHKQVGFKGFIHLVIKGDESDKELRWLPYLLILGSYLNLGKYRTVGMGKIVCSFPNPEQK